MRKPDIFDEIIQCLKTDAQTGADTAMSEETLRDFFARPVRKAPAPAANAQTIAGDQGREANRGRQQPQTRPAPSASPSNVRAQDKQGIPPAYAPDMPEWESLRTECAGCMKCGLGRTRTNMVFADGNPHAELMFIGEGPGADEDATGVPFVGRAGELLSRMIAAMTFDRATETCIANIVKCRPPGNRNPADDEAAACMPYLKRQIAMVNPKVIVLLGAVPLLYLFNLKGIMKLRGRWLDYNGIPVMPTYHPAFLLRNPPAKKDAWADLQAVMAVFGRKPAPRR
jgi:DNA polymerase